MSNKQNVGATGLVARSNQEWYNCRVFQLGDFNITNIRNERVIMYEVQYIVAWWQSFQLTKCQTKGSTEALLAQKYDWVDSEGILGRFAKYRLMRIQEKGCYSDVHGAVVVSEWQWEGNRMGVVIASDLLTRYSFWRMKPGIFAFHSSNIWLPRMKQYGLGGETILFELPNTSVWRVKQYCSGVKM